MSNVFYDINVDNRPICRMISKFTVGLSRLLLKILWNCHMTAIIWYKEYGFHNLPPGFMIQWNDFTCHNGAIAQVKINIWSKALLHNQARNLCMSNYDPDNNGSKSLLL